MTLRRRGHKKRHTNRFAADDLAKYDVLPVEVRRGGTCDEELGAVCVGASISLRAVG